MVGAGCPRVQGPSLGSGLSNGVQAGRPLLGTETLSPDLWAPPSRASGLARWGGSLGMSTGSCCFGGIVLIPFEARHCPHIASHQPLAFSIRPCPRGNAFIFFSVTKDSGSPAPTFEGPCTFSCFSYPTSFPPSDNLHLDSPLGEPSSSALSPCRLSGAAQHHCLGQGWSCNPNRTSLGTFNGWMGSIYCQWVNKLVKHNSEDDEVIFGTTRKESIYIKNEHRKKVEKRDR